APFLRSNHPAVRILLQMLYAFQSFALNAGLNSIYGIKYSFLTNNREARQIAAATLAMAASYHAVNLYLIRPMYEASSAAIFGDDEEEDEEKNYTKEDEFLWATLWDVLIAQWAPNFLESAIKSTGAEYLKSRAERKGEEFDIRKDIPLYVPESRKDIMAEGVGIYGNIGLAAADIGTMTLNALDRLEAGEELEVDAITVDGIRAWLLLSKMMPMRGDLQKLLRNYSKKLKAEERAAKERKTFPEGVEGIEVGTEFELPDYSIDIPDDPTELPEIE
ncbi:MAG TPA: hypothetical protein VGD26_08565, partial [Chitinophagaceae bacterium]